MVNNINLAPCIYFSLADDGTLLEVNQQLCAALAYVPDMLIGQKVDLIFTLPTRIFQQTHFFPLLKMQGHAEEIFITLRKKDGDPLPVLINAEQKVQNGKAILLYVGIIVHNRNKFEEELIAAKKTAEKALNENTALAQARQELQQRAEALEWQMQLSKKQNEELKQFNRVVTHDLQEPLRKMAVFSSMLETDEVKIDQKKIVEKISSVMHKMNSTISGLQKYVWLNETPPQWKAIDMEELLSAVIQTLTDEHPGIQLSVDTKGLLKFEGDVEQIRLLFYELLSNAVRYRRKENEAFVNITANTLQLNTFKYVEGKYKYSNYLRLLITDNGIGFDAVYSEQVFELFKRLHQQSGRGIGLSLCKKVVDNHQGNISIYSTTETGTTVTIDLPLLNVAEPKIIEKEQASKFTKQF